LISGVNALRKQKSVNAVQYKTNQAFVTTVAANKRDW